MPEERDRSARPSRVYPPLYEKAVPAALAVILVAMVVLLAVIACVALGLLPGAS